MSVSKAKVWSTKLINETLKQIERGERSVDTSCFWSFDQNFRAAHIHFEMTQYETEEFVKCSEDIHYFAEKYCKILTDEGVDNIKLRKYQKKILKTFKNEQFSILVASRQIGKCSLYNTKIVIKNNFDKKLYSTTLGSFYFYILSKERKLTVLENIKWKLWRIYEFLDN